MQFEEKKDAQIFMQNLVQSIRNSFKQTKQMKSAVTSMATALLVGEVSNFIKISPHWLRDPSSRHYHQCYHRGESRLGYPILTLNSFRTWGERLEKQCRSH